jgi:ribonuclease R
VSARRAPERPRRTAATLVAVLERRGRFLTAEPLFPPRRQPDEGQRPQRATRRITLRRGSARKGVEAKPGDIVLLELAHRGGEAQVARVIGRPEVARDVIAALTLDRGLAGSFPGAVETEAREQAARAQLPAGGRRDLRDLATLTIDPASARDFDDAISAEELGEGRVRVWVHIADVAAHVAEGSALDREARRRATSVYVPGAVEPMLPFALSSEACSLVPGADRWAVTVELDLNADRVVSASFYRSLIRSDMRLDYEQVDRIFAGAEPAQEPWAAPLRAARGVAAELQRERSGALAVDSEEPEFAFDEDGNVLEIHARRQTESHRLIEHLMIAANEAVAALLAERGVPCLYRVHERPDPARIRRLVDQLASLEVPTPPLPESMSSTDAARLVGEISQSVERYVRQSGRGRIAFGALILRSLKQAYYSPTNIGHAGLRSTAYCHFTSPIRRYPDIVCHRALLSAVGGEESAPAASDLGELGAWTSEREREAMQIERDADDIARCFALEQVLVRRGQDGAFEGEVAGLIPAGAFVAFGAGDADGPAFEGLVPVRTFRAGGGAEHGREWWALNEEGTILFGERTGAAVRLGDRLAVDVGRVDTIRGRVDLVPAER